MGKIKLFCIPYAGGSGDVYVRWKQYMDPSIELIPLELAGRGKRHRLPYYDDMGQAAQDILENIKGQVGQDQYGIFGHSMGSIMAYEAAKHVGDYGLHQPIHIFFSGRYPPRMNKPRELLHKLPDEEFRKRMLELGGIPQSLMVHKGLLNLILNTLRADLKIAENYVCLHGNEPFDFDITVLEGYGDKLVDVEDMEGWREYTKGKCTFYSFEGGHFFIHKHVEEITAIINDTLTKAASCCEKKG